MFANPTPLGLACLNHAKLWTFAKFSERVIVTVLSTISLLFQAGSLPKLWLQSDATDGGAAKTQACRTSPSGA
jgi:hypothetical protein